MCKTPARFNLRSIRQPHIYVHHFTLLLPAPQDASIPHARWLAEPHNPLRHSLSKPPPRLVGESRSGPPSRHSSTSLCHMYDKSPSLTLSRRRRSSGRLGVDEEVEAARARVVCISDTHNRQAELSPTRRHSHPSRGPHRNRHGGRTRCRARLARRSTTHVQDRRRRKPRHRGPNRNFTFSNRAETHLHLQL